jgi:hypothetical protein
MTLIERADASIAALDETGQAIARRVLLRLVSFSDGPALAVGNAPERLTQTLRHLADARLLTLEGDEAGAARVELADEALLAWPALQAWIRSHGAVEQQRRQLETDATAWRRRADQGDAGVGLLDKPQLSELAAWLTSDAKRDLGLSELAETFIAASRDASRRRWWPASIGTALAVMLILMLLATPIVLLFVVVLSAWVIHRFL